MIKIAITGNIAAGKSSVENYLQKKGFKVYDTDKIGHDILKNSNEVLKLFGTVDRKEIAKIVFANKEKLSLLESIIHPKIKKEIETLFRTVEDTIFISVPQLFESGFDSMFDKIIFVTADEGIRKERLIRRNSLTSEEAQIRINAQKKEEEKIDKCDFIIENNKTIEDLEKQVDKIISELS